MDQQAFHAEQLLIQQEIEEALAHAKALGLSDDEVNLLAAASGIQLGNGNHEQIKSN